MKIEYGKNSVKTLRELFTSLKYDGFNIEFERIPITDELAPQEQDFDQLVNTLKTFPAGSGAAIIFNCQMGRGRTTTGLVCAYLLNQNVLKSWKPKNDFSEKSAEHPPDYRRGEYHVILKIVSTIEDGELIKAQVDDAIDACSEMQNLRDAIYECKVTSENPATSEIDKKMYFKRGINYLERYWWLILFNTYLNNTAPKFPRSFTKWMQSRWGYRRMLRKLDLV